MTVWLTALFLAISTIAAGLIGTGAALRAARAERLEGRRREALAALSDYVAAVTTIVGEISSMPAVPEERAVDRIANVVRVGLYGRTGAELEIRRRARQYAGDRPQETAERFIYAWSRVRVVLSDERFDAVADRLADYVLELGDDRTPERLERWPELREELFSGIDRLRAELD